MIGQLDIFSAPLPTLIKTWISRIIFLTYLLVRTHQLLTKLWQYGDPPRCPVLLKCEKQMFFGAVVRFREDEQRVSSPRSPDDVHAGLVCVAFSCQPEDKPPAAFRENGFKSERMRLTASGLHLQSKTHQSPPCSIQSGFYFVLMC